MSLYKKAGAAVIAAGGVAEPGRALGVQSIQYDTIKNELVHLEWARERDNYVYQWKMLKKSVLTEEAILARLMAAVDDLLPKETHVYFDKPVTEGELVFPFWTIRVADIANRPGAKEVCEKKIVDVLSRLNVWT